MTKQQLLAGIKKHTDVIAKERDALRDLLSDAEEIAENCDAALADLERAADTLSQLL